MLHHLVSYLGVVFVVLYVPREPHVCRASQTHVDVHARNTFTDHQYLESAIDQACNPVFHLSSLEMIAV